MARIRVKGPSGAVALVTVPGPGMDQRTFDARVARGELTILDQPSADVPSDDGPVDEDGPPPRAGRGSGRDAWVAWAANVTDAPESAYGALSRDEIIALLEDEGVLDREE